MRNQRTDQNNLDIDVKKLSSVNNRLQFHSVHSKKSLAVNEALSLRLRGCSAFVQNGLGGKYEVVFANNLQDVRKLTSEYQEVSAGIWAYTKPGWDKGSLWTLHKSEDDGTLLISRVDECADDELAEPIQKSSTINRSSAEYQNLKIGSTIQYVDDKGNFTTGKIHDIDRLLQCYLVINADTLQKDYVEIEAKTSTDPFVLDPSYDDDFTYFAQPHSEEAYSSDSPDDAHEYDQNDEDVEGNEIVNASAEEMDQWLKEVESEYDVTSTEEDDEDEWY